MGYLAILQTRRGLCHVDKRGPQEVARLDIAVLLQVLH